MRGISTTEPIADADIATAACPPASAAHRRLRPQGGALRHFEARASNAIAQDVDAGRGGGDTSNGRAAAIRPARRRPPSLPIRRSEPELWPMMDWVLSTRRFRSGESGLHADRTRRCTGRSARATCGSASRQSRPARPREGRRCDLVRGDDRRRRQRRRTGRENRATGMDFISGLTKPRAVAPGATVEVVKCIRTADPTGLLHARRHHAVAADPGQRRVR